MLSENLKQQHAATLRQMPVSDAMPVNSLSPVAWFIIAALSFLVFALFLLFDPQPNLLLALCCGLNVTIILSALAVLFKWDLLLSPVSAVFLGPGWFVYYTIGNLGARIAGEDRYVANFGSLKYYPTAALLSTIGLGIFCIVVFGPLFRQLRHWRIRYQDLHWEVWQVVAITALALGVLGYLSSKYAFQGGYFRNVNSEFDSWLAYSQYLLPILGVVASISALFQNTTFSRRLICFVCLFIIVLIYLGLRSRTALVLMSSTAFLCWVTLRPKMLGRAVLVGSILAIVLFGMGTVVKVIGARVQASSIQDNLALFRNTDLAALFEINQINLEIDWSYRLAGLEYPAAMISIHSQGTAPMYGDGLVGGVMQGIPGILRPRAVFSSEGAAISDYYLRRGLFYDDTVGIPLTSGLADWGIFGVAIYAVIGIYCVLLWRVVQLSPRIMVAYLAVGTGISQLFWDGAIGNFRFLGFAFLLFLALHWLVMPKWKPQAKVVDDLSQQAT